MIRTFRFLPVLLPGVLLAGALTASISAFADDAATAEDPSSAAVAEAEDPPLPPGYDDDGADGCPIHGLEGVITWKWWLRWVPDGDGTNPGQFSEWWLIVTIRLPGGQVVTLEIGPFQYTPGDGDGPKPPYRPFEGETPRIIVR